MEVLHKHRAKVSHWRTQLERMFTLHSQIFDAQRESWALRSNYVEGRDVEINRLHDEIGTMEQEIELIRETYFGSVSTSDRHAGRSRELVADATSVNSPSMDSAAQGSHRAAVPMEAAQAVAAAPEETAQPAAPADPAAAPPSGSRGGPTQRG